MSLGIIATKRRIKSVNSTKKITKAMQLVSTSKLKRCRDIFDKNSVYTSETLKLVQEVLKNVKDVDNQYLIKKDIKSKLYIVVTSNLGLCGGYNANVLSLVKDKVDVENDYIITLGTKGNSFFNKRNYKISYSEEEETTGHEQEISKKVALKALEMFTNNEVGEVHIIYTKFVNSLTFKACDLLLLPVEIEEKEVSGPTQELVIEPNADEVLNELLPFYFNSVIYGSLVESHVSEQASRRTAMENATDNAEEISGKLLIQYNKARQSAITQEITEVVAGANASS
jgi:F-type H+-transporting ATPase subunit gamma